MSPLQRPICLMLSREITATYSMNYRKYKKCRNTLCDPRTLWPKGSAVELYSGGVQFDPRPATLTEAVRCLQSLQANSEMVPILYQNLPDPFQLNIHKSFYQSALYRLRVDT
jgi:hypothetical protein